jgi:F0F1-type ATP synthase membrane subunit b/b'
MKPITDRRPLGGHRAGAATAAPFVAALGASLLFAGCASTPPPTAALQSAQQAIDDAERNQASAHAPEQLSEAHTKLASAKAAVDSRHMDEAARLAEEARADAELAAARTSADKAKAANDEIRKGTQALKDELQRGSTGSAPPATYPPATPTTPPTGGSTP